MVDPSLTPVAARSRRALVVGHLSTVGDIEVLDWVEARLAELGVPHDVSAYSWRLRDAKPGWVDGRTVDPGLYSHLVVVCGPLDRAQFRSEIDLFARFSHCVWIGVNLTMIEPLDRFNPFDVLLERDSDRTVRPDLSLALKVDRVPVVGVCFAGWQREYGAKQQHDLARKRLLALAERRSAAVLELDTKWPASRNKTGIRSPSEFELLSVARRRPPDDAAARHGAGAEERRAGGRGRRDPRRRQGHRAGACHRLARGLCRRHRVGRRPLTAALGRCLAPAARKRARASAEAAACALDTLGAEFARALHAAPGRRSLPPDPYLKARRFWALFHEREMRFRAGRSKA